MTNDTIAMIAFPASTLTIGLICSIITKPQIKSWYDKLIKPNFVPPNWVFAPVWTIIYILIGISGYLIWKDDPIFFEGKNLLACVVYFIQLFLNYSFVFVFFSFHWMLWSFIQNLILVSIIVVTILLFSKINEESALLLLPYFIWGLISTYFTFKIWRLNDRNPSAGAELQILNDP